MTDIIKMNDADLAKHIRDKRDELQKMRFGVTGSALRNSHAIRTTRREIARALTEYTKRTKVGA